jgi:putative FmdB family regulatory protein
VPIYDFACRSCGVRFEVLVAFSERASCPACGGSELERLLSPIAPPAKFGLRGGDARRSDARRHAREEQRRERREARKQGGG